MKRIPFLILVFMLTTGFFKSALEKCADIDIRDAPQFNKNGIYKRALDFSSLTQKIVARPYHHCIIGTWWFVNSRAEFCCSALHIHTLLGIIDVHTWHICLLSR